MRKQRKKITADDLIIEQETKVVIPETKIEKVEKIEKDYNFFVSDEKFSTTWEQPNNQCNRTTLYQTLEIKTENCNDVDYFVLQSNLWCFTDVDDLIYILLDFKKRYEKMKTP
jgi:hypothetical protein